MKKLIRPTYPAGVNFIIVFLIFVSSCFFSHNIFDLRFHVEYKERAYLGMILIGVAVVLMLLIIWEEILFPIKVKELNDGMIFRNHRTKLKVQIIIYSFIPVIFAFIYMEYDVNYFYFGIWFVICAITPVAQKIFSGLKNYNDFLKLTESEIEYKNNSKHGTFAIKDIQSIGLSKDATKVITKLHLTTQGGVTTIDIDEMELYAFHEIIDEFIDEKYKSLIR